MASSPQSSAMRMMMVPSSLAANTAAAAAAAAAAYSIPPSSYLTSTAPAIAVEINIRIKLIEPNCSSICFPKAKKMATLIDI